MLNIGPWEILMIVAVALIVVGPGKLPELGKSIGKSMREIKKATGNIQDDINKIIKGDD